MEHLYKTTDPKLSKPAPVMNTNEYEKKLIDVVQKNRNAKFIATMPVSKGSTLSGYVFYQSNPPNKEYSKYFIVFINTEGKVMITSGRRFETDTFTGCITHSKGEFFYSTNRHDYIEYDGCMLDGGDAYTKSFADNKGDLVEFKVTPEGLEVI